MRQFLRAAPAAEPPSPEQRFQALKAEVHRQMVEALDLSQLAPGDRNGCAARCWA